MVKFLYIELRLSTYEVKVVFSDFLGLEYDRIDLHCVLFCRQHGTYFAQVSGKIDSDALCSKQEDVMCKLWHNEFLFHHSYSSHQHHLNAKHVATSISTGTSKNIRVPKPAELPTRYIFFKLVLSPRARVISNVTLGTQQDISFSFIFLALALLINGTMFCIWPLFL